MASLIDFDFNPPERTLRQFGFIALVGFGVLAAMAWTEILLFSFGLGEARATVAGVLVAIGVVAALCSLVYPRANRALFVGLTILAAPIGFVLSYVILGLIFYAVIAPTGLILRLFGRDPLQRGFQPQATTYWKDAAEPQSNESYFKQF